MRYSEFNKKLYEFELQHHLSDIHIFCDGNLVGKVSKKCRYSLSTIYEIFEDLPEKVAFMLYENMMMLAETPLAEREEVEKNFRLRLKTTLPMWNDETYLNYFIHDKKYFVSNIDDTNNVRSTFTESEISNMDTCGFERVEVI